MIEKIQNFLEDNTSVEVTKNQVIMLLVVVGTLFVLILVLMFGSNGPKKDKAGDNIVLPTFSSKATTK